MFSFAYSGCIYSFKSASFGWPMPCLGYIFLYPYLPTPQLGQDMTQNQFLSGV